MNYVCLYNSVVKLDVKMKKLWMKNSETETNVNELQNTKNEENLMKKTSKFLRKL